MTGAILVFDGDPPDDGTRRDLSLGPLRVLYAGPGAGAADRRIVELVEARARPREWTVVTSDRALGQACRTRGALWQRAAEFRSLLEQALARGEDETRGALGPDEVADWLAWFEQKASRDDS
jgi:predicted RNA-binding protein with PIN domain